MRAFRLIACLLSLSATGPSIADTASVLERLPETNARLLREHLAPQGLASAAALRQYLEASRIELDAATDAEDAVVRGRRAAARASELTALREQARRDLHNLEEAARARGSADDAGHISRLREQVDARFDNLEERFTRWRNAPQGAERRRARSELRTTLASLHRASATQPATVPVPTLAPLQPAAEPPTDQPPTSLPAYARAEQAVEADELLARGGFRLYRTAITPPVLAPEAATDCSAVAADLADDGKDVRLTAPIRALAASLDHSPARILRWMQQNIAFDPYWGALKGAEGVLQTRAGNSTDQASLLIALLRASNVPSRYVRGTVQLYDAAGQDDAAGRAQRWLGTQRYRASAAVLAAGGVPAGLQSIDGELRGIRFDHVWVQACVPHAAYRGARAEAGGYRWLALDAAVKDHDYQQGIAVDVPLTNTAFYTPYLASRSEQLPHEHYAEKVASALRTIDPTAALADVPYAGTPRPLRYDVLPGSLPYMVEAFTNWPTIGVPETASLPDAHRHTFTVTVRNGTTTQTSATLPYPQSALKRITLSYQPTPATQAAWNAWTGKMPLAAYGSIQVMPQIRVDGTVVATGSAANAMPLAGVHSVVLKVSQGERSGATCINDSGNPADPRDNDGSCINKTVYTNIKAGAYHALGLNALHTSNAFLGERLAALAAGIQAHPVAPTPASGAGYDATVGELLHLVLQDYLHHTKQADRHNAALRGFRSVGTYDIGLTASDLETEYIFDIPVAIKPAGVFVDFKGGRYGFVKLDSTAQTAAERAAENIDLAKLSIYTGSALEHHVWQQALRTDAVSTVRGLQFAAEHGIPLVTFTAANIGQYDSLMQMSGATSMAAYKSAIQSAVRGSDNGNHGIVTVPRSQIAYADPVEPARRWTGAVYMVENPVTGEYSAIINGTIAGGFPLLNSTPFSTLYTPSALAPSAVLAGNDGAGALQALPGGTQGDSSWIAKAGDPVNMLTGNYTQQARDFTIKGRGGLPIVLERWFNAQDATDGPFGFGWTHSFNHHLRFYGVEDGQAKVGWVDGTGAQRFYAFATAASIPPGATLSAQPGVFTTLTRLADGRFRIREANGLTYTFESLTSPTSRPATGAEPRARLLAIADRNGNTLTLNYSDGKLASIRDSLARTVLTFTWSANRIAQVTDFSGRSFSYAYEDGHGNLNRVTDPLGQITHYSYYTSADGPRLDHALRRHTLPRGNGMEFEYYAGGQVFRHTPFDTRGELIPDSALTFHYNTFRRESWTVDGRGAEERFLFDTHGNVIRQSAANGATHDYQYEDPNDPHLRTAMIDPLGQITRYQYTTEGYLHTLTLPSGAVREWHDFDAFGQPRRIKDARGNWTLQHFDAAGTLTDIIRLRTGIIPTAGATPAPAHIAAWTKFRGDDVGNLTGLKHLREWAGATLGDFASGSGPLITTVFDAARFNVTHLTRSGLRNGAPITDTSPPFTHDPLGRLTNGIDARWYPLQFEYDALDRATLHTDALGQPRRHRFDANGNPVGIEQIAGGHRIDAAAAAYDGLDRLISQLDNAGNRSTYDYDAVGNRIRVQSPDGYAIGFDYDLAGRPFTAYDQGGNRVYSAYDAAGRVRALIDPNGAALLYGYHDETQDGRPARLTHPPIPGQSSGRAVETDYDAGGLPIRIRAIGADGQSREAHRFHDALGRLVRSVSAPDDNGQRLQICYSYDALSHLTQLRAGATTDTTSPSCTGNPAVELDQTWDDFGNLLSRSDALGRTWTYRWDSHGNLIESTSPEQAKAGTNTTYTYDATLNGLLARLSAGGPAGHSHIYARNALGQPTRAETRDGGNNLIVAYDYQYDAAHRLARITDSRTGKAIDYTWTPGGRLAGIALEAHLWRFQYDATGRLAALVAPNGASVALSRDAAGRLLERRWADGARSAFTWHPEGSLAAVEHSAAQATIARFDYTYDAWGNRATATETIAAQTPRAHTYAYDALDRLSAHTTDGELIATYTFDLYGNRSSQIAGGITTTYLHDAAQQLTEIQHNGLTTERLVYDDNGNLKKHCQGNASGTGTECTGSTVLTLAWNGLDQLIQASTTGLPVETYAYDDSGRRLSKTIGGTATHYAYAGPDLLAEYTNPALPPTAVYAHGAGIDEPLLRLTGSTHSPSATARHYAQDGIGSVIAAFGDIAEGGPLPAESVSATHNTNATAYPPATLIDGDTTGSGGFWAGSSTNLATNPATVTLELGSTQTVSRLTLHRVTAYSANYIVKDAEVQVRNPDNSWTTVGTLTGNTTADSPEIPLSNATGSAIKVLIKAVRSGNLVLMAELSMRADGGAQAIATQRFDPWGKVAASSGTIPQFGYTGREPDATGLVFYRARYYHPQTGRFVSRDPLGFAAGINPYAYANGNPVRYNDPDGLLAQLAWNTGAQYWGQTTDWLGRNGTTLLDGTQTVLDVAGLVPGFGEFADGANALIYLGRGDYVNASLSGAAMIPFAGWGATAAKVGNRVDNAVDATRALPIPGNTAVYQSFDNLGNVNYIGITDNFSQRASTHLREKGIVIEAVPGLQGISRYDARAIEQVLIESHGLGKNGGTLLNQINSIAPTNPIYNSSVLRGQQLLNGIGY